MMKTYGYHNILSNYNVFCSFFILLLSDQIHILSFSFSFCVVVREDKLNFHCFFRPLCNQIYLLHVDLKILRWKGKHANVFKKKKRTVVIDLKQNFKRSVHKIYDSYGSLRFLLPLVFLISFEWDLLTPLPSPIRHFLWTSPKPKS